MQMGDAPAPAAAGGGRGGFGRGFGDRGGRGDRGRGRGDRGRGASRCFALLLCMRCLTAMPRVAEATLACSPCCDTQSYGLAKRFSITLAAHQHFTLTRAAPPS